VETAGETGGDFAAHRGAAFPDVGRRTQNGKPWRLLRAALVICLPLMVFEGVYLHRSTAPAPGVEAQLRRSMSDTLALVTVLNSYRQATGEYPERLHDLIPSHWEGRDRAELAAYDYRRVSGGRFELLPRLTGSRDQDSGIVRARAVIPHNLGPDSDLGVFLGMASGPVTAKGDGS